MRTRGFDHVVLSTGDVEACIAFYRRLGYPILHEDEWRRGEVRSVAIQVGADAKINVHPPELWQDRRFTLRAPAAWPGCGDLCLTFEGSGEEMRAWLQAAGAEIVAGPVHRRGGADGGQRTGTSIYTRDPDGNLLEFIAYEAPAGGSPPHLLTGFHREELGFTLRPDGGLYEEDPGLRFSRAASARRHAFGAGPFCRFQVASVPDSAGVYVFLVDGAFQYVGSSWNLRRRLNHEYGRIAPRACFAGGQETNCRINALLREARAGGRRVEVMFKASPRPRFLESALIASLQPLWNLRRLGHQAQRPGPAGSPP